MTGLIKEMAKMEVENVIRVRQFSHADSDDNGNRQTKDLWLLSQPIGEIADRLDIDRRGPNRKKGYQRAVKDRRLGGGKRGLVGYLENQQGILGTSVLTNIRSDGKNGDELEFDKEKSLGPNIAVGTLHIPDDATWWIVDGQHRIEGLKKAQRRDPDFAEYPVIITMTNESRAEEMLTFYIHNDRQKGVSTDLSYRILQRMLYGRDVDDWVEDALMTGADKRKAKAASVVDEMNNRGGSPFQGEIREVGEPENGHLVDDQPMIRYISLILKSDLLSGMDYKDIADVLVDYWQAVETTWPDAFGDPDNHYLLTTIGLSSLTRLLPTIYSLCVKDGENVSQAAMEQYLSHLTEDAEPGGQPPLDADVARPIDDEWWHKHQSPAQSLLSATGEGAYKNLKEQFERKINQIRQEG